MTFAAVNRAARILICFIMVYNAPHIILCATVIPSEYANEPACPFRHGISCCYNIIVLSDGFYSLS